MRRLYIINIVVDSKNLLPLFLIRRCHTYMFNDMRKIMFESRLITQPTGDGCSTGVSVHRPRDTHAQNRAFPIKKKSLPTR